MLTVWDSPVEPSELTGSVYTWNGYAERGSIRSLLRHVEENGERLRRKYLDWIHDLGESLIEGKRLVEHLAVDGGLSYWWMTLLVEQSPWKSAGIIDAIRILALEEVVDSQRPEAIRLVSLDRNLHEVIFELARARGVPYEWVKPAGGAPRALTLRGIYRALPRSIQALMSLTRYVCGRWPFRRLSRTGWFEGERSVFFCSYFFFLDGPRARQGAFRSRYWEGLPDLIKRQGLVSNWLQLYFPHDGVPTPGVAVDWIRRFNERSREEGFHTALDAYLSWRIVGRVLRHWWQLLVLSMRLRSVSEGFRPADSQVSLWPLLKGDWLDSMRGSTAMSNLLAIELFDAALGRLQPQRMGLYLCENHAWERSFVHAWRKHGHGRLIGVQHSTVRFWDLRYFRDPRTILASGPYAMPQPDVMALNGRAAVEAYEGVDYPSERIVESEALRYGFLENCRDRGASQRLRGPATRVLLLGDYNLPGTMTMLRLLADALPRLPGRMRFTLKPHPNAMVDAAYCASLGVTVRTEPLSEILDEFDIACASNGTSAAIDAYLFGLPVVVVLDDRDLNFSPLRGRSGVAFAGTSQELADALEATVGAAPGIEQFFFLDPNLRRWRALLGHPEGELALS